MRLASLDNGRPDGQLVVVSRDGQRCAPAGRIAPTALAALDDWSEAAPKLTALWRQLSEGEIAGQPFDPRRSLAPLPRARRWISGTAYLAGLERAGRAVPLDRSRPLLTEGAADGFSAATESINLPSSDLSPDFEAELLVVTTAVPAGIETEAALETIALLGLCNDVTWRSLAAEELTSGLGVFHAKPGVACAPFLATPDEFAGAWREGRLSASLEIDVSGRAYGRLDTADMTFGFGQLIAEAARYRPLSAGTVIGTGPVANRHEETLPLGPNGRGFATIGHARLAETAKYGRARTPFLAVGDEVRISVRSASSTLAFGEIRQGVIPRQA